MTGHPHICGLLWRLIALALLASLVTAAAWGVAAWRAARVATLCVRVTSAGKVPWAERQVPVAGMKAELAREAVQFRGYGFRPRLLIERYADTREADVAALRAIGLAAGFEQVDVARLDWPSP